MLTPAEPGPVPDELLPPDGSSKFRARNSEIYATQDLLDAETRLLRGRRDPDAPARPPRVAAALVTPGCDRPGRAAPVGRAGRRRHGGHVRTAGRRARRRRRAPGSRRPWRPSAPPGRPRPGRVGGRAGAVRGRRGGARRRGRGAHGEHREVDRREPTHTRTPTDPERMPTRLARAYPSPADASPARGGGRRLRWRYQRWACGAGSWSSSTKRPWPPRRTWTTSPPPPRRRGRRCCSWGTGRSCRRCRPGERSSFSPTTATTPPQLLDVRRFPQSGNAPPPSAPRRAPRGRDATWARPGRAGGAREDMLDLLFDALAGRHRRRPPLAHARRRRATR